MTLKESKDFVAWLAIIYLMASCVNKILDASPLLRDSSDEKGWFTSRSNLSIHRDKLTGCQYLSSPNGGITPRMLHGEHMGCEKMTND